MLSYHHATGVGDLDAHMSVYARLDKRDDVRRGLIFCGGGGATEDSWSAGSIFSPPIIVNLVQVLCGDFPYGKWQRMATCPMDWTWGNQDVIDRISALWDQAQDDYGFADTKVHFLTTSMGALCGLNWVYQHLASVASFTGVIPLVDPQTLEIDDLLQPYITAEGGNGAIPGQPSAAYGGPVPNAFCPARHASAYRGIPGLLLYSNNDSILDPDITRTFAAAAHFTAINLGDQAPGFRIPGHAADNLPDYNEQIAAFMRSNS